MKKEAIPKSGGLFCFGYDRRGWYVPPGGSKQGLLANNRGSRGRLSAKGFLLFFLSATNRRYWQSLGFHPPKRRPWRWAAPPSVATPCGSASIFGKWRIKGNKGNPLCGQPSPRPTLICQQALLRIARPQEYTCPAGLA